MIRIKVPSSSLNKRDNIKNNITYKNNKKETSLLTQITRTNNLVIISASKNDEERKFYLTLGSNKCLK